MPEASDATRPDGPAGGTTVQSEPLVLGGEFPPAEHEAWLGLVGKVLLKGRDDVTPELITEAIERRLVTDTDGIAARPLYVADDALDLPPAGLPGSPPFVRGAEATGSWGGWDIRQQVEVAGDGADAAAVVLRELERGTTSLLLGLRTTPSIDVDTLDRALEGVYLELAPLALDAGERWEAAADAVAELWARRGIDPLEARAVLGADPIGEHAATGGAGDVERAVACAAERAAVDALELPNVRTVVVDAARYHEAGASDAEELGCAVATGMVYLRALVAAGLPPGVACGQLEFRFAATADQFSTIAKLRAARRLWARAAEVSGAPRSARGQRQHAVVSRAMTTRYDTWVNLLRATTACFGAAVGGADAITVPPHDVLVGGSELGRRMARNVQVVLAEESHLARVIDPAGGSWYVESLTDTLARAGWAWAQELEGAGGIVAALQRGLVADRLAETRRTRDEEIATRRRPLTGLTEFPNVDEAPPEPERDASSDEAVRPTTAFPQVRPIRYADPVESLRGRADRHADATGQRPAVFLASLGPLASHTARATFSANLFAVGGVRSVGGPAPGDPDGTAAAFADSGTTVACICADDEHLDADGPAAARALRDAGAVRIYVAGRPSEREPFVAAGVDEFIRAGDDVLAILTGVLEALEVP